MKHLAFASFAAGLLLLIALDHVLPPDGRGLSVSLSFSSASGRLGFEAALAIPFS